MSDCIKAEMVVEAEIESFLQQPCYEFENKVSNLVRGLVLGSCEEKGVNYCINMRTSRDATNNIT